MPTHLKKGKVVNISQEALEISKELHDFKKLIILPDYSPSSKGLPVGCVAVFDRNNHTIKPNYMGQDIGCGMLAARIDLDRASLEDCMDKIAKELLARKGDGLGTLGQGNHFITVYEIKNDKLNYIILIHSGSRGEGKKFYNNCLNLTLQEDEYFEQQKYVLEHASKNRRSLLELVTDILKTEAHIISDKTHNFIEQSEGHIIYRKGNVKALAEDVRDVSIIPSSMAGDAVLVTAKPLIAQIEYAIPHATGRIISRSEAKAKQFFLQGYPENVYIPSFLTPKNLNQELPQNYRRLDDMLPKISDYVAIQARLTPLSSIML